MSLDIKSMYQEKAEEFAQEYHGKDFYDLDDETQRQVFNNAIESVHDGLLDQADRLLDEMKMDRALGIKGKINLVRCEACGSDYLDNTQHICKK